jgi:hypothetical protein
MGRVLTLRRMVIACKTQQVACSTSEQILSKSRHWHTLKVINMTNQLTVYLHVSMLCIILYTSASTGTTPFTVAMKQVLWECAKATDLAHFCVSHI